MTAETANFNGGSKPNQRVSGETLRWAVLTSLLAAVGSCVATAFAIGVVSGEATLTDPRTLWVVLAVVPVIAFVITFRAVVRRAKVRDDAFGSLGPPTR